MQRMKTVAGLDNGLQSRSRSASERGLAEEDLAKVASDHAGRRLLALAALQATTGDWNFWTDDAERGAGDPEAVQTVTVVHGHTHQLLTNRIGNIHFHGMLSTAWPWPYAPEGLPKLTVQMNRADPFNHNDGCGDGTITVHPRRATPTRLYNLWNRNPMTVSRKLSGVEWREGPPGENDRHRAGQRAPGMHRWHKK